MPYQSDLPYHTHRINVAAIYCSDGRVTEQYDDFLVNGLGLPCYDRLAVPGGPACLAGHPETQVETSGVMSKLRFLVQAHELNRVVLIQHEDCAFYKVCLETPETDIEDAQKEDLRRVAGMIRTVLGVERVDCYFARPSGDGVGFDPVSVDE